MPAPPPIAENGLSFTHAGLTAGDLVDVTYFWDYNGVYGEKNIWISWTVQVVKGR